MSYNDDMLERMKYYTEHILEPNDKFSFTCKQCGKCCTRRNEPIMITGVDLFYMARALKVNQMDFIKANCLVYIGDGSKLPVMVLKETKTGRCPLLKNNRCSVHDDKPTVCKLYPLGRFTTSDENDSYKYFIQPVECAGCHNAKEQTLKKWLDSFGINDRDEASKRWTGLMYKLVNYFRKHYEDEDIGSKYDVAFLLMYLNYDINKDFLQSLEENISMCDIYFKEE